jgi:YfiH family protein
VKHVDPVWVTPLDDGRTACVVMTDRGDGDLAVGQPLPVVDPKRRAVVDADWTWLKQVHGSSVVTVERPGHQAGALADGACTVSSSAPLSIQVADCAPVALISSAGAVAALHAGWQGLLEGIIEAGADAMTALGAAPTQAVVGPCIHAVAYEFGASDLDRVASVLGDEVRSQTSSGAPALDVPAAVRLALLRIGVAEVVDVGGCTAERADRWWSHRARGDTERQAMVVWIADPPEGTER